MEYKYPNTVELCSKPETVRYAWVLVVGDDPYIGMTYNGLLKVFKREGIEPEGPLPEGVTLKIVDIIDNVMIVIPKGFAVEKLLKGWRINYYNPNWILGKRK